MRNSDNYGLRTNNEAKNNKVERLDQQFLDKYPPLDIKNYVHIKKVGKNDQSKMFEVANNQTGETCIAKIFNDPKVLLREVEIFSQVSHQSMVKYYGYSCVDFENKPNPMIILEYLRNGTLHDIIELDRNNNALKTWNSTMQLINIYGIASAMSLLHSHDIVHCNLCTRNIMLDKFLCPKVGGFVFANFLNRMDIQDDPDQIYGQVSFVAPEIFDEAKYTKSSDVYSFSMIMYEIMEKVPPFDKLTSHQVIFKAIKDRPNFTNPIPEAYKSLIERCWSKEPNERPSFDQIVSELKTNEDFITDDVDVELYRSFVELIDKSREGIDISDGYNQLFSKLNFDSIYDQLDQLFKGRIKANREKILSLIKSLNVKELDLNNYKKNKEVNYGAFCNVFEIIDTKTNQIYAAKVLNKDKSQTVDFLKELKILSDLKHPLIIKLIGYSLKDFNQKSSLIIVTEFVDNGNLERILDNERKFFKIDNVWNETMKLINIYGIASSINYLHSQNILHLDIKPSNVLTNEFLFPKLCDFGLSMKVGSGDKMMLSSIRGTYPFIAPEIFSDRTFSKKSDVYAFGILLYEIKAKVLPFESYFPYQIIPKVQNSERPTFFNPIDKVYQDLIEECRDQEPSKRPSFDLILLRLRTDSNFITEEVDEKLYKLFIEMIDDSLNGVNVAEKVNQNFYKYNLDSIYDEYLKDANQSIIRSNKEETQDQIFVLDDDFNFEENDKGKNVHQDSTSEVKEYHNTKTGKTVHVTISKVKIDETLIDQEKALLIKQEIKSLVKLKHPVIERFYGYSTHDEKNQPKPMTIHECLDSYRTLNDISKKEKNCEHDSKWTMTQKLINIYGIASGMMYLHSQGLVHPNLNAKNIIIDKNYQPKLTDIGNYTRIKGNLNFTKKLTSTFFDEMYFYLSHMV